MRPAASVALGRLGLNLGSEVVLSGGLIHCQGIDGRVKHRIGEETRGQMTNVNYPYHYGQAPAGQLTPYHNLNSDISPRMQAHMTVAQQELRNGTLLVRFVRTPGEALTYDLSRSPTLTCRPKVGQARRIELRTWGREAVPARYRSG